MKPFTTPILLALLFPYIVAFTPDQEDTSSTTLELVLGIGSYAEVSRDCNGNVTNVRDFPFNEVGVGITHRISILTLGATGGYTSNLFTNNHLADRFGGLWYVTPRIGVDEQYGGFELGYLIPVNKASDSEIPGYPQLHLGGTGVPTGMLRLGNRDSWFVSSSFAHNNPLLSGGGIFDVGLGFADKPRLYWVGLGVWPYDGVALSLKGDIPLSSNFLLNARAQIAGTETFEYGVSLGGKIIF